MSLQVAQGPLTDRVRVSDFLKSEFAQPYCRTAGTIQNTAVAAIVAGQIVVGQPLVKISDGVWRTALAADGSTIHGWFIDTRLHEALAHNATTKDKYQILERGPGFINQSRFVLLDPDGGALTAANQLTAGLAMSPPVRDFKEPATSQIQST